MLHYAAYIYPTLTNIKVNFYYWESFKIILIDENNEYNFPVSDASDTNKKPDKYFLFKKYSWII